MENPTQVNQVKATVALPQLTDAQLGAAGWTPGQVKEVRKYHKVAGRARNAHQRALCRRYSDAQRQVYMLAKITKITKADHVSDKSILGLLLNVYESGAVVCGAYSEVWGWVATELVVDAPFYHTRAHQLGRVGRKFEVLTGVTFESVCPDLRASAGTWSSDLG